MLKMNFEKNVNSKPPISNDCYTYVKHHSKLIKYLKRSKKPNSENTEF